VIDGEVTRGFEGVGEAFERNFSGLGESGAAFTALVGGRVVVDLWGGDRFAPDSLVNVWSVTKPMAAFCVLLLVDRGALALDDPVARHWPEFAQAGKERVTVRQLLSHQAGLVALRDQPPPDLLFDWDRTCALLAAEAPWWEPGTGHGEHAFFYGHLCGEVVRRVDGRSLGTFWREEVAEPWGLDFYIGLDEAERARAADLVGSVPLPEGELFKISVSNAPEVRDLAVVNSDAWRAAEIPAVNGHGTARAIARFYAALVAGGELDGVRLVSPATVAAMTAGELTAHDRLLEEEETWGLGVWVDHDGYGMGGVGGSLGMADPALGLAEAYVTRQMGDHERSDAMDAAIRAALLG
jgi:CubicO group peptidase (beta-lactamase class C family)